MNAPPMMITPEWLLANKAFANQYATFCDEWPEGMAMSITNLNRALELKIDLEWLAEKMLPRALYDDYETKHDSIYDDYYAERLPIIAEYYARCAPTRADFHAKSAPVTNEYYAKRALFNDGNLKAHYPTTAEYLVTLEPFAIEYEAKCATLLDELEAKCAPLTTDYESKRDSLLITFISDYYRDRGYVL